MTTEQQPDPLDVLVCNIGARPAGAPSFNDIMPAIRRVERAPGTLTIDVSPDAFEAVEGCVAAERLCCAGIGWALDREPAPRLRITATPAQLDLLEQLFSAR